MRCQAGNRYEDNEVERILIRDRGIRVHVTRITPHISPQKLVS